MSAHHDANQELIQLIHQTYAKVSGNVIPWGTQTLTLFDAPLIGFASADDEIFKDFQSPSIVSPKHMTPSEWLPDAKSVISLFFPIAETIRVSNRSQSSMPSPEWLRARIEGQAFISAFMAEFTRWFTARGLSACVPALDPRFSQFTAAADTTGPTMFSNWSERHAAYACGLGTFSLSKGLITERGMAGRFASIIVSLPTEPTKRPYTDPYEYCIRCGACIPRCPVNAISLENGKDNLICRDWIGEVRKACDPRYGCGKCQTTVPCEYTNPSKR